MSTSSPNGRNSTGADHRGHEGRARPHLIYLAIGFPPAAKSCAYRMRETANQFRRIGWDVTVVTIAAASWERDSGLDYTLLEQVDPEIKVLELPLAREDLETDIRKFSEERALRPAKWLTNLRKREKKIFPEPVFGSWRGTLERAVLDIHRQHPADLLLASCVPYVNLAAAWKLWETYGVPYAVDFRDGWSIDVVNGGTAFPEDSEAGVWERRILDHCQSLWVVNDPIAEHYRERYPHVADRVHVVRNGYDKDSVPAIQPRRPDPEVGLTFGYLGTVNYTTQQLSVVLNAWREARKQDPLLRNARFEIRGHIGAGANREANGLTELIREAAVDGVSFGGPVRKAEVAETYAGWDALVLILIGGRYVTSGKVYEYMATGLPIVSVHEVDHDASRVLDGHPLWTGACGLDELRLVDSFRSAARMVVEATETERAAVRAHADPFTRESLMRRAVEQLAEHALAAPRDLPVNGAVVHPSAASVTMDETERAGGVHA
ncbi:glycosyltransferase [Micromonospora globbae]|uniref:Glycosyltransferase n=1 Tax=Micromonospora globbae TaxID=1894969 RepID=A0ABZ1SFT4_9ACTN|nr:glycosyltransferase [Micromonospora globbae]